MPYSSKQWKLFLLRTQTRDLHRSSVSETRFRTLTVTVQTIFLIWSHSELSVSSVFHKPTHEPMKTSMETNHPILAIVTKHKVQFIQLGFLSLFQHVTELNVPYNRSIFIIQHLNLVNMQASEQQRCDMRSFVH